MNFVKKYEYNFLKEKNDKYKDENLVWMKQEEKDKFEFELIGFFQN